MPIDFAPARNRDAWAVFRGYVYQVNITVDRWLELHPGQILELERGEDVDLLGRATAAVGAERERLLEQVKHLEGTITLRSAAAREFIANAYAHRRSNPHQTLCFRFTTTAEPAVERPTTMSDAVPGIVAWEQIRTGAWREAELPVALQATRELLTSSVPPRGLPESIWTDFQAFIGDADDARLTDFLNVCEWSTKHIPAADYEDQLQQKLVGMDLAPEVTVAASLYDRLFAFVFRLLTQPGLKRLTREELLEQVALWRAGVPLSPEDDRRVRELREIVRLLEERMAAVESSVTELRAVTAGSAAMIDALARQQGIAAAVEYVTRVVSLQEPPRVERASSRAVTVSEVLGRRSGANWLALHGVSGIGKSQLALSVAQAASANRVWIRFRDLSVSAACLRLDAALAQLAGAVWAGSMPPDLIPIDPRAALAKIGRGAIIVLDDLPRYRAGDDLSARLLAMLGAAKEQGVLIVSTSAFLVPTAVLDAFAEGEIMPLVAPPFTVEEVSEVLSAHGAPEPWKMEGIAQLVHTATGGHPTLVHACARDLAVRGWVADTFELGRVLASDFAAGVNDETVRALIHSAPDPLAREMLFRLNLVRGEFTMDEVYLLAGVQPAIQQPRAHFDPLLGLWVQSDGGGRYSISPLVRPLGGAELGPDTRRACHARLAERIVSARVMSDLDASRAITHFISAEAYDAAGWVLLRGLFSLRDVDLSSGIQPVFAHIWLDFPLPEEMDLGLRLMVRALQLGICARTGRDEHYVREDLERLSVRAGQVEPWATFAAHMFAAEALAARDIAAAGSHLVRALKLRPTVTVALQDHGLTIPDFPIEQLIWMMTPAVTSPEALTAWLDVLYEMTADQRHAAFEFNDIGRAGAALVANRLMLAEEKKPTGHRDWIGVLRALESTTTRAEAMGLQLLADAAVVARMTILGEFLRDLTGAEALAKEVLKRTGLDGNTEFQVANSMALLLYDYGAPEFAREWLTRAFDLRTDAYVRESVRVGVFLSIRLAASDPQRAVDVLAETTQFADAHPGDDGLPRIEAYGERAVAEWLIGDHLAAFRSWDMTTTLLLAAKEDSSDWKSLAVLVGHNSGYFASVAATGRPPGLLQDGEPYAPPTRGLFALRPAARPDAFSEVKSSYLLIQLAHLADALGIRDRASYWARMATDRFRGAGQHHELLLLLPILITGAVGTNEFDEALEVAWEYGGIVEAMRLTGSVSAESGEPGPSALEVLGPEGGEPWLSAEAVALSVLVPIFFQSALHARATAADVSSLMSALNRGLRRCAARSADPSVWHAAVDLFDQIFMTQVSDPHLVARANTYAFRHSDSSLPLKAVAYLAASTRPGSSLDRSLALQLAVGPYLAQLLPRARGFGTGTGEFLATLWRPRFEGARFLFSNPSQVKRELDRADSAGPAQARLVLAAVAKGLGAPVPASIRAWLFDRSTDQ
jgi:hypothetical protein